MRTIRQFFSQVPRFLSTHSPSSKMLLLVIAFVWVMTQTVYQSSGDALACLAHINLQYIGDQKKKYMGEQEGQNSTTK